MPIPNFIFWFHRKSSVFLSIEEKIAFEVNQVEDVLFWWSNLCDATNVDKECSKVIIHYVVARDFAFVARWMEEFKQGSKKNL